MEAAKQSLLPSYLTQYEQGQTKLDKTQEQFVVIKKRNGEARIAKINNRTDVADWYTNIKLLKYTMQGNQKVKLQETNLDVAIWDDQIQALFDPNQKIEDIQELMTQSDMKEYLKSIENNEKPDNAPKLTKTTNKTKKWLTNIFQNIEKNKGERDMYYKTINDLEWKEKQKFMRKLLKYLLLKDKNTEDYRKDILWGFWEETSIKINEYTIEIKNWAINIIYWNKRLSVVEWDATNKFFNITTNSLGDNWKITINWEVIEQDNWTPYEPKSQIDGKSMLKLLCAIVGCNKKSTDPKPKRKPKRKPIDPDPKPIDPDPKPIDPDPKPIDPKIDNETIKTKATITTIGQLSKDEALKIAEQEYQDMYNNLRKNREETKAGNTNLNNATRLTRFSFNAKRIRQGMNKAKFIRNRVTELMQTDASANDLFVEKGVSATNFHETQNKYKINTEVEEEIFNNPKIDHIITQYVNWNIDETEFKKQINQLIEEFRDSDNPEHEQIKQYFKNIEIKSSHKRNSKVSIAATNLLEKAEALKAEWELAEKIIQLYEEKLDFEIFKNKTNELVAEYINNYKKIPEIKSLINETAEDQEAKEQLMLKIRQKAFIFKKKLERGQIQTNLSLLWSKNGSLTKAYAVDEKKLQNGPLEKWAHRIKNAHPARRRTARLWLAAAYGAGSVLTMGLANTAIAWTAVWVRKRRDYADQYKNMQERIAQDYDNTAEWIQQQEVIANDDGSHYNRIQRHMAKTQLKLYKETMQNNVKFTEDVINELSHALVNEDTKSLKSLVIDTMARLRMAQKSKKERVAGINFLRSKKQENAWEEYNQLHKLLDLALQTLNIWPNDIYPSDEYQKIEKELWNEAREKIKIYETEKSNMGLKYGLISWTLHGVISAWVQFDILGYIGEKTGTTGLLWHRDPTGRFGGLKEAWTHTVITWYQSQIIDKTPDQRGFDPKIDADMQRIYGTDYQSIKDALDPVKHNYNRSENDLLELKKQLAKSFKEWVAFKPIDANWQLEIVKLATDSWNLIHNLNKWYVMNNETFTNTIQKWFSNISPEYHNFLKDQSWLTKVMKGIVDGSIDPQTLPAYQKRIATEAFHQFFHDPKDITQLYFDMIPGQDIIEQVPITETITEQVQRKSPRDRIGLPTFWQTVMRWKNKNIKKSLTKPQKWETEPKKWKPKSKDPKKIIAQPPTKDNPDGPFQPDPTPPTPKKWYKILWTSTRWPNQIIKKDWNLKNADIWHYEDQFPWNGEILSPKDMSKELLSLWSFNIKPEDWDQYLALTKDQHTDQEIQNFFTQKIQKERDEVARFKEEQDINGIITHTLLEVTNELEDTLGEELSKHMNKSINLKRIHIVGMYDYQAIFWKGNKALGVFRSITGDIYCSFEYLSTILQKQWKNAMIEEVKHIVAHESMHAISAMTYFEYGKDKTDFDTWNTTPWAWRVWLRFIWVNSHKKWFGYNKDHGTGMNEALTEHLAQNVLKRIYGPSFQPKRTAYPQEIKIMEDLIEASSKRWDDKLSRQDFINARALRKSSDKKSPLTKLIHKIDWRHSDVNILWERPYYRQLFTNLMEYESKNKHYDYPLTRKFINWENVIMTQKVIPYIDKTLIKWLLRKIPWDKNNQTIQQKFYPQIALGIPQLQQTQQTQQS